MTSASQPAAGLATLPGAGRAGPAGESLAGPPGAVRDGAAGAGTGTAPAAESGPAGEPVGGFGGVAPPPGALPARERRAGGRPRREPRDLADAAEHAPEGLSERLLALARMVEIGTARSGRDAFSKDALADAEDVLARAGDRMRLSARHTVVALAGGTGSGKSSLFNRLAGAELSAVGVTRPVTSQAHACVWDEQGSGALLDWLGVPARHRYSRASALDGGEQDLAGLVLLDLPDHDSVMSHASDLADRFVSLADVLVWVLDPQKYADAAVHDRFLVPLASHSGVLVVVLNQADLLDGGQLDDCVADLRRLLDAEGLHDVPVMVTSAVTGYGLAELRALLADGVAARQAAVARIAADVDRAAAGLLPYAGNLGAPVTGIPPQAPGLLTDTFCAAAGVAAIGDALLSARELRAADFVGWPAAWLALRLAGRDPLRKVRLGMLWNDLRSVTAGPSGAQQAEIDNALTHLGDQVAGPLPRPWAQTVRAAVRSRADQIPAAIGAAIGKSLPAEKTAQWWWWLGDLWQGLLAGAAGLGVLWIAMIGVLHGLGAHPAGLAEVDPLALTPWLTLGTVLALVLGWLTETIGLRVVRRRARREHARVAAAARQHIAEVVNSMVIDPAERELSELARYRDEVTIAMGGPHAG